MVVEVAAVEVGVGDDGAARHFVESDVLGVQVRRAGDDHRMRQALGVAQRPAQRLHAAQAAAEHGGQPRDAQPVEQPRLGIDPVLDGDHGEIRAVDAAGVRVLVHGPGRAKARSQVVDADHEEAVGIDRLARADHVVPPALAFRLVGIHAGHMVGGVEGMAHQHRVRAVGVELAIGLVGEVVVVDRGTALQRQGLLEMHGQRSGDEGHEKTRHR
ncbi:hypothetical protein D3C71_1526630 [compost metagenome]